jgi:hypothetical protein
MADTYAYTDAQVREYASVIREADAMKNRLWIAALGLTACAGAPRAEIAQPAAMLEMAPVVHETKVAASRSAAHPKASHSWLQFRDARSKWLDQLGEPLLACALAKPKAKSAQCKQREGSFEVAYGLTALHRLTRSSAFGAAAEQSVDRKALSTVSELEPYAAAWFLAMARERELGMRKDDLRELAQTVADDLEANLLALDDHTLTQGILFGSEKNVAWALVSLWRWAEHVDDIDRTARLADFTKTHFLQKDMDSWCPLPVDSEPETFEFFPPCLNRAMTVLTVMPDQIANPWLSEFAANQSGLTPMRDTPWTTHATLNFSRSFGLWTMYKTTSEPEYRKLYIDHIETQMSEIDRQHRSGGELDPWTAAFGVYAVSLSYGS